ncbi:MAG: hypothetical protein ACPGOY_04680 [Rhodospirillaceae bacterium]
MRLDLFEDLERLLQHLFHTHQAAQILAAKARVGYGIQGYGTNPFLRMAVLGTLVDGGGSAGAGDGLPEDVEVLADRIWDLLDRDAHVLCVSHAQRLSRPELPDPDDFLWEKGAWVKDAKGHRIGREWRRLPDNREVTFLHKEYDRWWLMMNHLAETLRREGLCPRVQFSAPEAMWPEGGYGPDREIRRSDKRAA